MSELNVDLVQAAQSEDHEAVLGGENSHTGIKGTLSPDRQVRFDQDDDDISFDEEKNRVVEEVEKEDDELSYDSDVPLEEEEPLKNILKEPKYTTTETETEYQEETKEDLKEESDNEEEPVPFLDMLFASKLVYQFASLRRIVLAHDEDYGDPTNGKMKVPFIEPELIITQNGERDMEHRKNAFLKYPVPLADIRSFIRMNSRFMIFEEGGKIIFNKKYKTEGVDKSVSKLPLPLLNEILGKDDADIWEFDDDFQDKDLVYGAIVNRTHKRVTIVFRGSQTKKDWGKNLSLHASKARHLMSLAQDGDLVQGKKVIKIHNGFGQYLFSETKTDRREKSKFEDLLDDLEDIYAYKDKEKGYDYSDYELCVTGHSLGGALAQLFSFTLGIRPPDDRKLYTTPINCITYASPRVGKKTFVKIFKELEKKHIVHHIRVTNDRDFIPVFPAFYIQTGVNVHLYEKKEAKVKYNQSRSLFSQFALSSLKAHAVEEYRRRLLEKEENKYLLKKTFKDFYKEYANIEVSDVPGVLIMRSSERE